MKNYLRIAFERTLKAAKKKTDGAVYWLEIIGGILLVVLIIIAIKTTSWDDVVTKVHDALDSIIEQITSYWKV